MLKQTEVSDVLMQTGVSDGLKQTDVSDVLKQTVLCCKIVTHKNCLIIACFINLGLFTVPEKKLYSN